MRYARRASRPDCSVDICCLLVWCGGRGDQNASIHELGQFSPKFLWLLRDFYLDLEVEKGHTLTLQEYLEQSLAPVAGSGSQVASKNSIREAVRSLFPQRECRALVRPVNDEKLLRQLDSVDPKELRDDFRRGLEDLMSTVLTMVWHCAVELGAVL